MIMPETLCPEGVEVEELENGSQSARLAPLICQTDCPTVLSVADTRFAVLASLTTASASQVVSTDGHCCCTLAYYLAIIRKRENTHARGTFCL